MAKDEPSTKPLLDKLGVKPGMRVALIRVADGDFTRELRSRARIVSAGGTGLDIAFLGVDEAGDMARMEALRETIKRDGAIWVVFRKGRKDFNENDVLRLGLDTGMVDVKIVRFSETHSATKFVIRKADR